MKPGRIVALVVGCLLVLPGVAMLAGGAALTAVYAFGRDADGYFEADLTTIESPTVAVVAGPADFGDEATPDWVFGALDLDLRLQVSSTSTDRAVFVGIGRDEDVDAYLAGVAFDEVDDIDGRRVDYRTRSGGDEVTPPTEESFWAVSADGVGTQEITWQPESGRWTAVVMNADGSPGIAVDVDVGAKAGFLLPLAITLLVLGLVITGGGVALIVVGASGARREHGELPPPATAEPAVVAERVTGDPVSVSAQLDPSLSRWQWLVKWFLAIPHFIVLVFLWIAFVVLTVVAFFAILFTRRYPRGMFDFNVGVLRWTWRVGYYATTGGLGTDRYPPFSLHAEPGDLAALDVAYPEDLSRWLPLVKWFLAIPHLVILGLLYGTGTAVADDDVFVVGALGLLGVLVLIAAVALLFTGRYLRGLFDLIIGLNRWAFRVIAYVALMTDRYPPFRLDQGPDEPIDAQLTDPDATPR
jgi:hypothetical protein